MNDFLRTILYPNSEKNDNGSFIIRDIFLKSFCNFDLKCPCIAYS